MAFIKVFATCLQKTYKASYCSKASVFYCICTAFSFLIPLILTFKTQGFWKKYDIYRENPFVYFKHHVLLVVETNDIQTPIIWSTIEVFNKNIGSLFRLISFEHIERDSDNDKRLDSFFANIEVPMKTHENVHVVKMILLFDYSLHKYSNMQMEVIAFVNVASPLPGSELFLKGDLRMYQKEPLKHTGFDFKYNRSILEKFEPHQFDFESVLSLYSEQNVSASLQNVYHVWKTGRGINQPFKIKISILYPEETILYKLGFWQLMKWAWVQYLSMLLVSLYICNKVKIFVFGAHLFCTVVDSPIKKEK